MVVPPTHTTRLPKPILLLANLLPLEQEALPSSLPGETLTYTVFFY
jgi:hypothetical protein